MMYIKYNKLYAGLIYYMKLNLIVRLYYEEDYFLMLLSLFFLGTYQSNVFAEE